MALMELARANVMRKLSAIMRLAGNLLPLLSLRVPHPNASSAERPPDRCSVDTNLAANPVQGQALRIQPDGMIYLPLIQPSPLHLDPATM